MNERIKELAEQCGFRSNPDIYDRNQSFDIQMFAELIIKECGKIADDTTFDLEGCTFEIQDKLNKHFEVKR